MGDLGKGWLELCTEEDYQAAASAACGATAPCASRVRVDTPQIEERATAPSPVWKRVLYCMHCRLASTSGLKTCICSC